jgi:hypothetical protein
MRCIKYIKLRKDDATQIMLNVKGFAN